MSIDDALHELDALGGHGTADFIVQEDGSVVHDVTVFTRPLQGKHPREFLAEASALGVIRPGDRIQVPAQGGGYSYVRIIRPGHV